MPARVLVAYAYKKGSTTGVAQAIAKEQEKAEIHAAVAEMDTVVTLDPYDAVILGTPGYSGILLGNVASFVRRHGERIDHIPVAAFLMGIAPVHLKAGDPVQVVELMEKYLQPVKPVAVTMCAGMLDPENQSFMERSLGRLLKVHLGGSIAGAHEDRIRKTWIGPSSRFSPSTQLFSIPWMQ